MLNLICILLTQYFSYDICKFFKNVVKFIKGEDIKVTKKEIDRFGLFVPIGREIFRLFNVNNFTSRKAHEIDALLHVFYVLVLHNCNITFLGLFTVLFIRIVIYARLFILATHQVNLLFFDRYTQNNTEVCNISSFSRIVIISIVNMLEIWYSMWYLGGLNSRVLLCFMICGTQLLASIVQLFNFKESCPPDDK